MASIRNYVEKTNDNLPCLFDNEKIEKTFKDIEMALSNDILIGSGNLYITTSRVIWISDNQSYDIDARYIILHAITRDPNSYHIPCLYCQLDTEIDDNETESDEDNMNDDTLTLEKVNEIYFGPKESNTLEDMFSAFSDIALANPDEDVQDELDGELIYNNDEVYLGSQQARILQNLDDLLEVPDQFKDN